MGVPPRFHWYPEMVPLPAVALAVSRVFPPVQKEGVPVIAAVGNAFTVSKVAEDVVEHPLLLVTVTVYEPPAVAV
jgi:hypothetical protein